MYYVIHLYMIEYLLENHIYFFYYLNPIEINKLTSVKTSFDKYLPNDIWCHILILNSKFNKIIEKPTSINLFNNNNNITTIDKSINTRGKYIYQYLSINLY